jgi:hypothetical protein
MIARAAPQALPPAALSLTPFSPVPSGALQQGLLTWAYTYPTGTLIRDILQSVAHHVFIAGPTGSGKTTLLYHLLSQLIVWCEVWIFDLKDDFPRFAATHPRILLFHDRFPFVPLKVPSYLSRHEHSMIFARTLAETFFAAELFLQVCLQGLERAYAEHVVPSIADLRHAVETLGTPKDTYQRRDAIQGVIQRLHRVELRNPVMATAREGFGVEDLCEQSLYLEVTYLTEVDEFLWTNLTTHLGIHHRAKNQRGGLRTALVMDEGAALWGEHAGKRHISGAPLLVGQLPTAREFGIAYFATSTTVNADETLIANCGTHAILPLATAEEAAIAKRRYGLSDEQTALLTRLPIGQFLLHLGRRWPTPIHAILPAIKIEKQVPPALWEYAVLRTNNRAPKAPPVPDLRSTPANPDPSAPKPTPAEPPRQPRESSTIPIPPPATPIVPLKDLALRLLRSVVRHLQPLTEHFIKLGIPRATGMKLKEHLLALGLVHEETAFIRSGRGGTAQLLAPTSAGIARSGITPTKQTRGGDSLQHQYLVQEIASVVGASIETLGADVVLRFDQAKHEPLATFLRSTENAKAFDAIKALSETSLLAIEVEVSDPAKTAPVNVRRNHQNGITLTIVAVLPKAFDATRRALSAKLLPGDGPWIIVDALELLDHLRAKTATRETVKNG